MKILRKDQLHTLSGQEEVQEHIEIRIPALDDLRALKDLRHVKSLSISDSTSLASLAGLEKLQTVEDVLGLQRLPRLRDLNGLVRLQSAGRITIHDCPELACIRGLSSLETIHREDREHPFAGELDLRDLPALRSLSGLDNLSSIQGGLHIFRCGVRSLEGLGKISKTRALHLSECPDLTALTGLGPLQRLSSISITSAPVSDLRGLEQVLDLDHLSVMECPVSQLTGLQASSLGVVELIGTSLATLEGFPRVRGIESLKIWRNPDLTSLKGLEKLETISMGLDVWKNPRLTRLDPLMSLESIGAALYRHTPKGLLIRSDLPLEDDGFPRGGDLRLAECPIESLQGLQNLKILGGRLRLEDLHHLKSLKALKHLRLIGGSLELLRCEHLKPESLPDSVSIQGAVLHQPRDTP